MATAEGTTVDGLVVARRPLVDGGRHLVAFELVYHPAVPEVERYSSAESVPVAVHELLLSHGVALDEVVGDRQVVCAVELDVLGGDAPLMLPPRRTVLVVEPDDLDESLEEVVAACGRRRPEGYRIAIALPAAAETLPPELRDVVDLVVVPAARLDHDDPRDSVRHLAGGAAGVLVRGCDTADDLRVALRSGALWFQGSAVQSPPVREGARIAPSALAQVRLGVELISRDLDVKRIEAVLRPEPALVAQLLDLAAAGRYRGMRGQVRSLREALVVMGNRRVQRWAAVTILGRHGNPDADVLVAGLVRARACELLAPAWGVDSDFAFTAGLISTLGDLLGVDGDTILSTLELNADLAGAAFRRQGRVGEGIDVVEDFQRTDRGPEEVAAAVAAAFGWATGVLAAMEA